MAEQKIHPAEYLEGYKIADTSATLKEEELTALNKFVIAVNEYSLKTNNQSYYIHTDCPVYKLYKKQYPTVQKLEKEGRHLIYLGDWASFAKEQLNKEDSSDY